MVEMMSQRLKIAASASFSHCIKATFALKMFSSKNVKRSVGRFVPSDLINKLNGEEEIF